MAVDWWFLDKESLRDGWDEEEYKDMDMELFVHWVIGGRFWIHVQMSGKEEGEVEEEAMNENQGLLEPN